MKKVVMILLSVTMLFVSCAKQTTITTEPTDSTTEALTETTGEVTEPTTEATEPSTEAPTEPDSEPKEGIYADLKKIDMMVIGEYATIQEAFAGYDLKRLPLDPPEYDWNKFWSTYQEEHPVGHKEAFYLDDRTDVGFLVEVSAPYSDGSKETIIEELYAFNKLYDVYDEAYYWGYKYRYYGGSSRTIYATDDMVTVIQHRSVRFICADTAYRLYQPIENVKDPFTYDGYMRDGAMRYAKGRAITRLHTVYDWALEYWYPGYGDELAVEYGTVTLENGELVFTPDETYTIYEWLVKVWKIDEKIDEFGCESIDELFEKYLSGEIDIFKHPSL